MAQGGYGMVVDHPWPGIAHHHLDAILHIRPVAMHRALAATGFMLPEGAFRQSYPGIFHQRPAIVAQFGVPLLAAAIYPYHLPYCPLFPLNPCHIASEHYAGSQHHLSIFDRTISEISAMRPSVRLILYIILIVFIMQESGHSIRLSIINHVFPLLLLRCHL